MRSAAERDILHPALWEIAGLGGLILFYVVANVTFGEAAYAFVDLVGEVWFGGVLVAGAVRAVRIDPVAMWTGVFWFRIASAVYFGFGSAFKLFFNEYTTELVDNYYWASAVDLYEVNVICAVAVFVFMAQSRVIAIFFPYDTPAEVEHPNDAILWWCGVVFSIVGYSAKYLIVIPDTLGLYGNTRAPGMLTNLMYLAVAGLFLLTLWCSKYALKYMFIPTLLLCADTITGTLELSKGQVLFPLIVYILGLCRYRASFNRLAVAAATVLLVFHTLVPAVQFGRAELERRFGNIDSGNLSERLEILSAYFAHGATEDPNASDLNSLARFYYANATAAAVNQYDSGQPGNSLMDAFTIFIPRAIWKDKPIYDTGARYNLSVVGDSNSSTWMGIFVEAYWNLGWFGIPIVMIPLAIGYDILGRMSIAIQKESKWLHFPVALFGVWMGMRIDSDIVETQILMFFACLFIYFAASFVETPLRYLLATPLGRDMVGPVAAARMSPQARMLGPNG